MKNALKKAAVFLTGISLLLNLCIPILAATQSAPQMTLELNKTSVARGGEIAVTVSVDPATTIGGSFTFFFEGIEPTYIKQVESADIDIEDSSSIQGTGLSIERTVTTKNKDAVTFLGTYYFEIPETATLGTYSVGLKEPSVTYNTGTVYGVSCDTVTFTVVEEEEEAETAQGWQAALSGPTTAEPEAEITYSITVTGDSFSAAQLALTYDSSQLLPGENDNIWSIGAGTATLVDHGDAKTVPHTYLLNMQTTSTEGGATVTLTSAAFGTSESAVEQDLTAATINNATVTTAIHQRSYSVAFQKDSGISCEGSSTVNYGENYTLTITDTDRAYYSYTVTAIMGGVAANVTDNGDGSYTVENVTGELKITITRTARQYQVIFAKARDSMNITLPNAGTVTYGTDYTCTLPTEDGYTLGVSVTIGGEDYEGYTFANNQLTIPGKDVKGDIVITIRRTTVPVSVEGSGAEDVVTYEKNATVGKSYTLTVTQDSNYNYSVTATAGGSKIAVTNNGDGEYTVQNVTDAGELVFTVNKSVKTNDVKVSEYVKCNGATCWLVVKKCNRLSSGVYAYQNNAMFWSDEYEGYCYLVIGTNVPAVSGDDLSIISGSATEIDYTGDVNMTKKIDANDAQLVYDLYNATYGDFSKVTMEKFLRADVNGNRCVDTTDAAAVVNTILGK